VNRQLGSNRGGAVALLAVGAALLILAVILSLQLWSARDHSPQIQWDLTLLGSQGQQIVLSHGDVLLLPQIETSGGFFTSVGAIHGPYPVRGVSIETLCDLVGGMTASDILFVTAQDGYSAVYDYHQLNGGVDAFEPDTIRHVPGGDVVFLLIYEQNGQSLTHADGGPLRLAIASADGLLTEGHWWVKWVNRIEIRQPHTLLPG
jgi:hypothetical protein